MQTRKCHADANANANADANRIRTKNNMSPSTSVGDIIIKYEKPKASILNILLNDQALQYLVELNSLICAHVVNGLLREKRKSIPNCFNGKKTFQKCNPPDFKFYLGKLNNKNFPHMVEC